MSSDSSWQGFSLNASLIGFGSVVFGSLIFLKNQVMSGRGLGLLGY